MPPIERPRPVLERPSNAVLLSLWGVPGRMGGLTAGAQQAGKSMAFRAGINLRVLPNPVRRCRSLHIPMKGCVEIGFTRFPIPTGIRYGRILCNRP